MIRWSDVMEEHKEQLIEALEQTFKEAVDCRYMQYITEIYQDGTIRTWSCAAVSNSFSHDTFVGKSHEVTRFCFAKNVKTSTWNGTKTNTPIQKRVKQWNAT